MTRGEWSFRANPTSAFASWAVEAHDEGREEPTEPARLVAVFFDEGDARAVAALPHLIAAADILLWEHSECGCCEGFDEWEGFVCGTCRMREALSRAMGRQP